MAVRQFQGIKQLLDSSCVHCAEIDQVLEKIKIIKSAGSKKLQVLCDFDHTLTCYHVNGKMGHTSHGVVEHSTLLPKSFNEKATSFRDKYLPIEHCHERSVQDKIGAMETWWQSIHQLIIDYSVKRETFQCMVKDANVRFREGMTELMLLLNKNEVPVTVFSAGLADIIQIAFQTYCSSIPDNLTIIGNRMIFNEQGTVVGFKEPLIHSYNKGMSAIQDCPSVINKLKDRPNIILLGDSQGDPGMIRGLSNVDTVLKIGFLNHKREALLPIYEQLYDIVLLGPESTLTTPLTIMDIILNH